MKIASFLKSLDKFGDSVSFNVNRQPKFGTWFGLLCTAVTLLLISCYAYVRFMVMWNYEDTMYQVKHVTQDDFDERVFTSEEVEFDFAFTFTRPTLNG